MIKRVFAITALLFSFSCHAERLSSYEAVFNAINEGKGIRAVLDINLCKSNILTQPRMIGSVEPKDLAVIVDKFITFSNLHFTQHNPDNDGKPLYESTKFILRPNQELTIDTVLLNPVTFKEQGKGYHLKCELNNGVNIYSIN